MLTRQIFENMVSTGYWYEIAGVGNVLLFWGKCIAYLIHDIVLVQRQTV